MFEFLITAGLAIFGLVLLVYGIRNWLRIRQELREQVERSRREELRKLRSTAILTYEDYVRNWNAQVKKYDVEIQRAIQTAQARCVETATPVLLTIYDYYETKDGDPITKIEDLPWDDQRRKDNGWDAELTIDDQRGSPHEQTGYGFLPAHSRVSWIAHRKARREALRNGALTRRDLPAPENGTQSAIDAHVAHRKWVKQAAHAAFAEELIKIKANAEAKARLIMQSSARRQEFDTEAKERNIPVAAVEQEFIDMCVKHAVTAAEDVYNRPDKQQVFQALTAERIFNSDMFVH